MIVVKSSKCTFHHGIPKVIWSGINSYLARKILPDAEVLTAPSHFIAKLK